MNRSIPWLLGALAVALSLIACSHHPPRAAHEASDPFGSLSLDQVEAMVTRHEGVIIDTNAEGRYRRGHVPGAIWLAATEVSADKLPADKDLPLVFYCANTH